MNKWIDINNEIPPDDPEYNDGTSIVVLIVGKRYKEDNKCCVLMGFRQDNESSGVIWFELNGGDLSYVTHWMYLPEFIQKP